MAANSTTVKRSSGGRSCRVASLYRAVEVIVPGPFCVFSVSSRESLDPIPSSSMTQSRIFFGHFFCENYPKTTTKLNKHSNWYVGKHLFKLVLIFSILEKKNVNVSSLTLGLLQAIQNKNSRKRDLNCFSF